MGSVLLSLLSTVVGALIGLLSTWVANRHNASQLGKELVHRTRERNADQLRSLYWQLLSTHDDMDAENRRLEQAQCGYGLGYYWNPEEENYITGGVRYGPIEHVYDAIDLLGSEPLVIAARKYIDSGYEVLGLPVGGEEHSEALLRSQRAAKDLRAAVREATNID